MRRESHKQYRGLWRNSRFWGSGIRGKITQARGSQGIHAGWRRRTARDVFVRLTQVQRSSPPAGWNSSGARCADSLMKTRTEGRFHLSLPLFPAVFSLPPPRRQPAVLSAGPLLELLGPASWSRPAPALRRAPAGCGPESWGGAFAALAALALLLGLPDGVGAEFDGRVWPWTCLMPAGAVRRWKRPRWRHYFRDSWWFSVSCTENLSFRTFCRQECVPSLRPTGALSHVRVRHTLPILP